MPKKQLVAETLIDLHRRLSTLAIRSHERRMIMQETANLYGVSVYPNRVSIEHSAKGASKGVAAPNRGTPTVLPQTRWSITANSLPPSTLLIFVLEAR